MSSVVIGVRWGLPVQVPSLQPLGGPQGDDEQTHLARWGDMSECVVPQFPMDWRAVSLILALKVVPRFAEGSCIQRPFLSRPLLLAEQDPEA